MQNKTFFLTRDIFVIDIRQMFQGRVPLTLRIIYAKNSINGGSLEITFSVPLGHLEPLKIFDLRFIYLIIIETKGASSYFKESI